jgi:hypothetical protein
MNVITSYVVVVYLEVGGGEDRDRDVNYGSRQRRDVRQSVSTLAPISRDASTMASSRRCASTRTLAYQLPVPFLHSLVLFFIILFFGQHHAIGFPSH